MKIAVINFSGNVGKTTVARQLLAPRLAGAQEICVETINTGDADSGGTAERWKGKEFGSLQEQLMQIDSAIVDIGASNVEEFIKLMAQFDGSHAEFDYYVVPVVREKKQQTDSVNTIKTLARIGVAPERIRVVFNRVDIDDEADLSAAFAMLLGFHTIEGRFTLRPQALIYENEIFDRLRILKRTVAQVLADPTDYRAQLRSAADDGQRASIVGMISAQRLARSAQANLDAVYAALFS